MLSCSCSYDDDYDYWYSPDEFFNELQTKRSRKCCSCKAKIAVGDQCLKFNIYRRPLYDIEERIYGDEVPLADKYMCEACGEVFLNLHDLKYCVDIYSSMQEALKEYHNLTGFIKPKETKS